MQSYKSILTILIMKIIKQIDFYQLFGVKENRGIKREFKNSSSEW